MICKPAKALADPDGSRVKREKLVFPFGARQPGGSFTVLTTTIFRTDSAATDEIRASVRS